MLIFKCPECEESLMGFNEADNTFVCSGAECQHELAADEATSLFEAGELIGYVESSIDEKDEEDDEDESDSEDDEDMEDDEEDDDDEKDESFNGFANRATWLVNLVVQNEYKINKGALKALAEENAEAALKAFVEENVIKSEEFAEVLAGLKVETVNWVEVLESLKTTSEEMAAIRADLESALGVNEEVSEEDRKAIALVFESALTVKYNELKGNLEEKFAADLATAKEENFETLTVEMSKYLDEAIAEWREENKIAIEHGIQTELTKRFMNEMKDVFSKYFVDIPEERFDVLEDLSDKLEEMDEALAESKAREAELQNKLNEASKETIIRKLAEELTDTQVEKLEELAGSIDYESEEQFESALSMLKESFLKAPKARKDGDTVVVEEKEDLNEDDDEVNVDLNNPIALAARGLRRKA